MGCACVLAASTHLDQHTRTLTPPPNTHAHSHPHPTHARPPPSRYELLNGESLTADLYVSAMPVDIFRKLMPEEWYRQPFFRWALQALCLCIVLCVRKPKCALGKVGGG